MIVNGRDRVVEFDSSIEKLLLDLRLDVDKVVVEIDGEIISRENFSKITLKESNIVEVISFVGGG